MIREVVCPNVLVQVVNEDDSLSEVSMILQRIEDVSQYLEMVSFKSHKR